MQQNPSFERHPLLSLILLLFLALAGSILFYYVSLAAGYLVYGSGLTINSALAGTDPKSVGFFKIFNICSGIGTFILPSLFFARITSGDTKSYLKMNTLIPLACAVLAVAVVFAFSPALEFFVNLNKAMKLPGALKVVEEWMRQKEDETAGLVKKILVMNSRLDLNINLLMVAIIPAIGEEFFFRGCLQQIMGRWLKSDHLAVWITAILFSAIHVQFFGFLPRMLLGALLGYLYVWGKSIWLPVLAHFTNNAVMVVGYYVYQQKGLDPDKLGTYENTTAAVYIGSAILTAMLLYAYWRAGRDSALTENEANGE